MFGDVAKMLLRLMGRRETIPGEIEPDDIPHALAELQKGIAETADSSEDETEPTQSNGDENERVSLRTRALPLIELFEAAREENVPVMWEEGGRKF